MLYTIELSEPSERKLGQLARDSGQSVDAVLGELAEAALHGRRSTAMDSIANRPESAERTSRINSIGGVMGGDACVRNPRIPVWMLVGYQRAGLTDGKILENFPSLVTADLTAAWDFYAANSDRVHAEQKRHDEAN